MSGWHIKSTRDRASGLPFFDSQVTRHPLHTNENLRIEDLTPIVLFSTPRRILRILIIQNISARLLRLGSRVAGAGQINQLREVVTRLLTIAGLRRRLPRSVPPAIAVRLALL